jgi:hypothetical protein
MYVAHLSLSSDARSAAKRKIDDREENVADRHAAFRRGLG